MDSKFVKDMVSVIVPVYNVAAYLSRCLDSILNNTYKNLELICVDDGSTDESYLILKKYELKDRRVHVIRKENGGAASARREGLLYSHGEYIAMLDADDWVHSQYFEILVNIQKESNSQIVVCRHQVCLKENPDSSDFKINQPIRYKTMKNIHECMEDSDIRSLVYGKIYTREIIGNHLPQEGIVMGEDTLFNILVMCSYPDVSVSVFDSSLYYYYMRSSSVMNTVSHSDMIYVSGWLLNNIAEFPLTEPRKEVLKRCIKVILFYRYSEFIGRSRSEKIEIKAVADKQFKQLYSASVNVLRLKDRILYMLLYKIPFLYRMFRILDDLSLLDWEKEIKIKRQQNREK